MSYKVFFKNGSNFSISQVDFKLLSDALRKNDSLEVFTLATETGPYLMIRVNEIVYIK